MSVTYKVGWVQFQPVVLTEDEDGNVIAQEALPMEVALWPHAARMEERMAEQMRSYREMKRQR